MRTTGPVKTDASSFDELRPVAKKLVKLREQAPLYKRSEGVLEDLVKLRAQAPFESHASSEDLVKLRAQAILRTI